jgi:putative transcriptional regulator
MQSFNLTNHFLIAMPQLADPNFARSVTYICVHNAEGAMGIVVNRPLEMALGEVLSQVDLKSVSTAIAERQVYRGGPVQTDRGFVLHRPPQAWQSSISVTPQVAVCTSRDILEAIARGDEPHDALVALGYAAWSAGQLEAEIAENAWLSGPADLDIVFKAPAEQRWQRAAALLGIDVHHISHDVGHA